MGKHILTFVCHTDLSKLGMHNLPRRFPSTAHDATRYLALAASCFSPPRYTTEVPPGILLALSISIVHATEVLPSIHMFDTPPWTDEEIYGRSNRGCLGTNHGLDLAMQRRLSLDPLPGACSIHPSPTPLLVSLLFVSGVHPCSRFPSAKLNAAHIIVNATVDLHARHIGQARPAVAGSVWICPFIPCPGRIPTHPPPLAMPSAGHVHSLQRTHSTTARGSDLGSAEVARRPVRIDRTVPTALRHVTSQPASQPLKGRVPCLAERPPPRHHPGNQRRIFCRTLPLLSLVSSAPALPSTSVSHPSSLRSPVKLLAVLAIPLIRSP